MKEKILSIVPYYGGKSKMCKLISEMLYTHNIDIFISPFGGGARDLLNAPKFPVEIYNDTSAGMCALVELLSNKETGVELIKRLLETEYDEEYFYECVEFRNQHEDNHLEHLLQNFKSFLRRIKKEYDIKVNLCRLLDKYIESIYLNSDINDNFVKCISELSLSKAHRKHIDFYMVQLSVIILNYKYLKEQQPENYSLNEKDLDFIENKAFQWLDWYRQKNGISANTTLGDEYQKIISKTIELLKQNRLKEKFIDSASNNRDIPMSTEEKYKLAVSTFVAYTQSFSAMGTFFAKGKYKTTDEYYNRILNLYECMHRLQGVKVSQVDAFSYFYDISKGGFSLDTDPQDDKLYMSEYLKNENVMIYCDPTYLKQDDESGLLPNPLTEYNPGIAYKHYWTREEHEMFLRLIRNAKCKLLVSNYDDSTHLYDKYLSGGNWKRLEIDTYTTVSTSGAQKRKEVLWYNY